MQTTVIPDFGTLTLASIIYNYNGTLVIDGVPEEAFATTSAVYL